MKSLRPIMIAAIALTPVPAFAQGGSMPDDGGPGSISAGSASTPELVPWTTQPRRIDVPPPAPPGVDPRTGQPLSTIDSATGLPRQPDPPATR